MGLFNFRGKKEFPKTSVCCSVERESVQDKSEDSCDRTGITNIKVLGAGCKACHEQFQNVKTAAESLNLHINVEYITEIEKIIEYSVMSFPAIIINEKLVFEGRVLNAEGVKQLLRKYLKSEDSM